MSKLKAQLTHPLAITMWDFSWLERRWPGAGYESWDLALDELKVRGYDAVRIDAYPHLIAADAEREWELLPVWNTQVWGSPALNRVRVQPHLNQFIAKCAERGLKVGLSTWYRQDRDDTRMKIKTPQDLGNVWHATLDSINQAGLLDTLLYVDLANEYPLPIWCPFLYPEGTKTTQFLLRASPEGIRWMMESINVVRQAYPDLDYCFSFCNEFDTWREQDVSMLDLLEPHIWMAQFGDFYKQVGYKYDLFETTSYDNLVQNGERIYQSDPEHWNADLIKGIELVSAWSSHINKPLITTECWSVVDYKDWPLLNWDWIKDLCELGVQTASATGRWAAMATSNFCGPQFVGMWCDVDWHRRLTDVIHSGKLPF